jgi:hypothetical protein
MLFACKLQRKCTKYVLHYFYIFRSIAKCILSVTLNKST